MPDSVERLKPAFRAAYDDDPSVDEISSADLLGEYPAVRYYPPSGDLFFDVMTRLGEVVRFEAVAAALLVPQGEGFERFARHCARYLADCPSCLPPGRLPIRSPNRVAPEPSLPAGAVLTSAQRFQVSLSRRCR